MSWHHQLELAATGSGDTEELVEIGLDRVLMQSLISTLSEEDLARITVSADSAFPVLEHNLVWSRDKDEERESFASWSTSVESSQIHLAISESDKTSAICGQDILIPEVSEAEVTDGEEVEEASLLNLRPILVLSQGFLCVLSVVDIVDDENWSLFRLLDDLGNDLILRNDIRAERSRLHLRIERCSVTGLDLELLQPVFSETIDSVGGTVEDQSFDLMVELMIRWSS